ncbi:MAG: sugar phosphate isomerase/epimerase [Acidobacteria bacterium]|nr:sugar phosphate isomerase/epimerase [Acidobacteriota bacterium]
MSFKRLTRREMMAEGARLTAAGLALKAGLTESSSGRRLALARGAGFKIGACDWTLGKRTDPSALEVAKKLGLDGIQVDLGRPQDDLPLRKPEVQQKYLEARKATGVEIASLAIGALNEVALKSDPRAAQWVSDSVDICKVFGVNVVLVAFFSKGDLRGDTQGAEVVIARLKEVAPKAEKAGVILGVESWLNADLHMEILDRVGSPAVEVYYDIGNSHRRGYDILKEIRFLGKHICEFHVKDNEELYGKGSMNFPEVRRAMDDIGYRGWMQIEGTKLPLGPEESVRYDLEYLRGIFPPEV